MPKYYKQLYLLLVLSYSLLADSNRENERIGVLPAFVDMVQDNISASVNYILPEDNEELSYVSPLEEGKIYDYGTFDFVIVGAGSAGSLLSNRLSEIGEWKILLLEAGGIENNFSDIPGMSIFLRHNEMNWGYLSVPQKRACKAMKNHKCDCSRGKVAGGSSTINAKMYVRGNKDDFDTWEKMGNTGWSYKDVLPYFIKTENSHIYDGDSGYRGKKGLLDVSYTDPTIFTSIYLKAKEELGDKVLDYNGKHQVGVSPVQFTIKGNKIASGGRAFIDPFLHRKNLNVTTNAFVTELLLDKETKTAIGVEFIKNGRKYQVKIKKEVILSAGAINTPQILMISGIGPKEELNKIGVETLIDLPVGKYMEDHPSFFGLNFRTNQTLFNESFEILLEKYLNNRRPFTAADNVDAVSFINVDDKSSSVPNVQQFTIVPPGEYSIGKKVLNLKNLESLIEPYNYIQIRVVLLHAKSKGSVTLKSKSPTDFPIIDYNYYAEEEDVRTMHKGIKESLKLLETQAFKSVNATYVPFLNVCTNYTEYTQKYWQCMIEHLTSTLYHVVGTTRMGVSRNNSVVSPKLTVHGVKKLRVVDAGTIPRITSGNVNAPTYMIAEKAADYIKEEYLSNSFKKANFDFSIL